MLSVSQFRGHISHFILYIKKESTCIYLPVKIKHYLIEFAVSCMNLHVFAKIIHQTLNNEGRIYSVMHLFASYLFTQDWLQGFLSNHCYSTKGSNTFKDCDDFFLLCNISLSLLLNVQINTFYPTFLHIIYCKDFCLTIVTVLREVIC